MSSLSIAYPETSIQEIVAAVVVRVLEANDVDAELMTGATDSLWPLLKDEEADIFATAWLPRDKAFVPDTYKAIGDFYTPQLLVCLNGEPGEITSLSDIARFAEDFEKDVIVMESFKEDIDNVLSTYGLKEKGFVARVFPDDEALKKIETLAEGDTPHLLPVLDPSYVVHDSTLQILEDPQKALPEPYKAVVLARKALLGEADYQEVWDELDELMITNKIVSIMDYAVHKQGLPADAAADAWQRGKLVQREDC